MQQRFERTYSFTDEGNTCCIDKRQLNYLLSNYEIVKTNFINLICNKLQTTSKLLNEGVPPTTEQRLLQFLRNNKICHNGSTSIKIKMENLASIISDTRLNVSKVLNDWQSRGLIELQRGCITITDDTMLFNLK